MKKATELPFTDFSYYRTYMLSQIGKLDTGNLMKKKKENDHLTKNKENIHHNISQISKSNRSNLPNQNSSKNLNISNDKSNLGFDYYGIIQINYIANNFDLNVFGKRLSEAKTPLEMSFHFSSEDFYYNKKTGIMKFVSPKFLSYPKLISYSRIIDIYIEELETGYSKVIIKLMQKNLENDNFILKFQFIVLLVIEEKVLHLFGYLRNKLFSDEEKIAMREEKIKCRANVNSLLDIYRSFIEEAEKEEDEKKKNSKITNDSALHNLNNLSQLSQIKEEKERTNEKEKQSFFIERISENPFEYANSNKKQNEEKFDKESYDILKEEITNCSPKILEKENPLLFSEENIQEKMSQNMVTRYNEKVQIDEEVNQNENFDQQNRPKPDFLKNTKPNSHHSDPVSSIKQEEIQSSNVENNKNLASHLDNLIINHKEDKQKQISPKAASQTHKNSKEINLEEEIINEGKQKQKQIEEKEQFERCKRILTEGRVFLKYGRNTFFKPSKRKILCDDALKNFYWKNGKRIKLFKISDIIEIKNGRNTVNFKRFGKKNERNDLSFSIVMSSRTVDLEAFDNKEKEEFLQALTLVLAKK